MASSSTPDKLIPGRFYSHHGKVYRIKKATFNCDGCLLNTVQKCPNIVCVNNPNQKHFPCDVYGVILVAP